MTRVFYPLFSLLKDILPLAGGSCVIYLQELEELGGPCTSIEMEGLYINLAVWKKKPFNKSKPIQTKQNFDIRVSLPWPGTIV